MTGNINDRAQAYAKAALDVWEQTDHVSLGKAVEDGFVAAIRTERERALREGAAIARAEIGESEAAFDVDGPPGGFNYEAACERIEDKILALVGVADD